MEQVEAAMDVLGKPVTTAEIFDYMKVKHATDLVIKSSINQKLLRLMKWATVGRLPAPHSIGGKEMIWYLTKNGNPHPDNCEKCNILKRVCSLKVGDMYARSEVTKVKRSDDGKSDDDYMSHNWFTKMIP